MCHSDNLGQAINAFCSELLQCFACAQFTLYNLLITLILSYRFSVKDQVIWAIKRVQMTSTFVDLRGWRG